MKTTAIAAIATGAAIAMLSNAAVAQEPASCRSPDPSDWPAPTKPYFMLVMDTSGSMTACTNPPTAYPRTCAPAATLNSCGLLPTRLNDAKCALRQTVQAFSGEVNFGLATYAILLSGCPGACVDTCLVDVAQCAAAGVPLSVCCYGNSYGCPAFAFPDNPGNGCGNLPACATGAGPAAPNFAEGTWRNGANIVVPLRQDPWWTGGAPPPDNTAQILEWFDGSCTGDREIFAVSTTPIAGSLRSATEYLRAGWALWNSSNPPTPAPNGYCSNPTFTFTTPMDTADRACRDVNILLVTDGDDTCEGTVAQGTAAAVAAASDLFNNGVTIGAKNWRVRTHVINFAGGTQSATDQIAAAGGTGVSLFATNEIQLSQALSSIISGAIQPEVCNNGDDNCNGCTDEGSRVYCNRAKTAVADPTQVGQCCNWTNQTQRNTCSSRWQATVNAGNPTGDEFELPCWTPGAEPGGFTAETSWLCVDPAEACDNVDNNCDAACADAPPYACGFDPAPSTPNAIDEGFTKCGSPLACPTTETCDGQDQDCDGVVDNASGSGVPFSLPGCTQCSPSSELCDGCDNDCDGRIDEGITPIPCGFSPPANCAGVRSCTEAAGSPFTPGSCLPGHPMSRLNACNNSTQAEICDGIDNDCDGFIDNGIPPTPCDVPVPPAPPGVPLNYGPNSQCRRGMLPCNGTCTGWIGPSTEVCDGIDNDCDGTVDDGVPGVGNPCGTATGQCQKGTTVCIGVGGIICQGGVPPANEVCNGLDDDCDGATDDAPLMDAPTNPNCWELPGGTCTPACSHAGFAWCPPPGGTCTGLGTLATPPCTTGTLDCNGTSGWRCVDSEGPVPEVCDGVDNDCDGTPDEMLGAPIGDQCGTDVGECEFGAQVCDMGVIDCLGGVGPKPEECNGLDDDCDGVLDNGIPLGGPCPAPYDTAAYPGDRTQGQCRPGNLECDMNGGLICVNGIGPSPEICDGLDNDCDGDTDESGMAPDGIDGTADPLDMTRHIGDPCGTDVGECQEGALGCVNGQVVCLNSVGEQPEKCDCADNDCNGIVDNMNDTGEPSLCSPGKDCVDVGDACFCAAPCAPTEFPCPTGTTCESVIISETQMPAPADYCIPVDPCGDCSTRTVNDAQGVVCAPDGTAGPFVPVCVCKGQDGCQNPCFGAPPCGPGLACVDVGPSAGTCQGADNCYFFGCPDGEACRGGVCVEDPCEPNTCTAPTPVCKPTAAFDAECTGSCAGVDCDPGKTCEGGACVDTGCGVDCATGEVCKPAGDGGFACGPDECVSADGGVPCPDGRHCDPVDGSCDDDPCTAVHCPATEVCKDGECVEGPTGTGGAGGTAGGAGGAAAGGSSGAGNTDASSGGTSGASGSGPAETRGVFGLATGGGGCACRTAPPRVRLHAFFGAIAVAGIAWRRRARARGR